MKTMRPMKLDTRLESAVFQLTPTRTRCDLLITADGNTERIASGLLNPFLDHLQFARDQLAKGGYSIILKPDPHADSEWFTKGTVERFVRFVSTPEVLERVTTIESEMLQIEDSIVLQGNDNLGRAAVDEHQSKSTDQSEGSKTSDADTKAVVVYVPGTQPTPTVSVDVVAPEENSKVQLLRVLETRKTVLQKEQAMAFARALAAGFDFDTMGQLVSFADCFGASRLKKGCSQFMELWKLKHETGQWIEVEAADAMSLRSELPPFAPSGIMFAGDLPHNLETVHDANGQSTANDEQKMSMNQQQSEWHYHQHAYPPWMMHPPPVPYSPYPVPYYQNYPPPGGSYMHPPYPPMDDVASRKSGRKGGRRRRHSEDSRDVVDVERKSQDDSDESSSENGEDSHGRESGRKSGHSGKKKPGVVVIRNVTYVPKKHKSSGSESSSDSQSQSEEDSVDSRAKSRKKKNGKLSSRSKRKDARDIVIDDSDTYNSKDAMAAGDSNSWQAFQSFILRAEEKARTDDGDLFSAEKRPPMRKRENGNEADPLVPHERGLENGRDWRTAGFDSVNGSSGGRVRRISSGDDFLASGDRSGLTDGHLKEIESAGGVYRSTSASEDFMMFSREKQMEQRQNILDPLADHEYDSRPAPAPADKSPVPAADESFMLPVRAGPHDDFGMEGRAAVDISLEIPFVSEKRSDLSSKVETELIYEPNELTVMREHGEESGFVCYDPAMDFETQTQVEKVAEEETIEDVVETAKEESPAKPEKEKKVERKKKDSVFKRLSAAKPSPLAEAQQRADKLRAYKANLQKAKKEMEEEKTKRLEALKQERQKRIAARTSSGNASSTAMAMKISPNSSKKLNSESSSTPLQLKKATARGAATVSSDPAKSTKTSSRLGGSSNGVSRSVSSLPNARKEDGSEDRGTGAIPTKKFSDVKSSGVDQNHRRSMPDESQAKKISAIIQLDESKLAVLPELKLKTEESVRINLNLSKPSSEENAVAEKNISIADDVRVSSVISSSDDTIEKAVVMLEKDVGANADVCCEPLVDDGKDMSRLELESASVAKAPPSPVYVNRVLDPVAMSSTHQVEIDYIEPSSDAAFGLGNPAVQVHDSVDLDTLDQNFEANGKPRKEPKGLRKLLKFGRKSHAPTDGAMDSDTSPVDDSPADGQLKNLIAQDDLQAGVSAKARHFSILSPFRSSKNTEKQAN